MNGHDSLITAAVEKGRAGVRSLAAKLRQQYAADCRAIADELAGPHDLSPFERQQLQDHLRRLHADFAERMAVLDELTSTYESLFTETRADPRSGMSIAIELAQRSLQLQKLFHEVQAADADRLFV